MPPADIEDTWSDDDDDLGPDLLTAVQLGIPDGSIHDTADLSDPSVSRLGGHPVRCPFAHPCTFRILISLSYNLSWFLHATISSRAYLDIPFRPTAAPCTCDMQQLLPTHGASRPNMVSLGRQPQRPRSLRLGVCQHSLPAQARQVRCLSLLST